MYGADGKTYIDMGSGIGVNAFGIADDEWVNAIISQANKVQHTSNLYYTSPSVELAQLLCEKTNMKRVFFANSGAEANECLIKVARKWACDNKGADYNVIVTLKNSFHGRTITTLAATGQDKFHELFLPLTSGFVSVNAGDISEIKKVFKDYKVAGVLLEFIQGEGGVNVLDYNYVKSLYELCKQENVLFLADEVQTGNGRTGELYAYMNYDVMPDVVSTAKGLGGGLPIGACLMNDKTANVLTPSTHGSTFGANPICCAGALTVIKRLTPEFLKEVKEKSEYIFSQLNNSNGIESVTGMGLMVGIKAKRPAIDVINECIENGVLCLSAKDKIRLLPPLNIDWENLKTAIKIIKDVCEGEK